MTQGVLRVIREAPAHGANPPRMDAGSTAGSGILVPKSGPAGQRGPGARQRSLGGVEGCAMAIGEVAVRIPADTAGLRRP